MSIATAPFGLSLQHNAMKTWTGTYWISAKLSTRQLMLKIHNDGAEPPGIGKESKPSTLILTRLTITINLTQRTLSNTKKPLKI